MLEAIDRYNEQQHDLLNNSIWGKNKQKHFPLNFVFHFFMNDDMGAGMQYLSFRGFFFTN
jgi:hypothetical protein